MIDRQGGCSPEICTVHSEKTEMGDSSKGKKGTVKTEGAAMQSVTITMVDPKSDQRIEIPGMGS
jgi:hypothetical protein